MENWKGGTKVISWDEFKKAFQDKYYPRSFCDAKQNEFLKLVQRSMSVAKYEKKYTELSKYATTIVTDETDQCKRFRGRVTGGNPYPRDSK